MPLEQKVSGSPTCRMSYQLNFIERVPASVILLTAFLKGDNSTNVHLNVALSGRNFLRIGSLVQARCKDCQVCSLGGIWLRLCQLFSTAMREALFLPRSDVREVFGASTLSFGVCLQGKLFTRLKF